jgi:Tfp pilus assembly protein PilP
MGETADQKRLLFLLAICLLSLTLLTWAISRKNRKKAVPIVFNSNPQTARMAEPDLQIAIPPLSVPEYSDWYIREKYQNPTAGSGRRDPFAKLPAEERREAEIAASPREYPEIAASASETEPLDSIRLRGILFGKEPIAYIEEPGGGAYRRVRVGDPVYGGKVESIAEKSVTISRRDGNRVTLKLGE